MASKRVPSPKEVVKVRRSKSIGASSGERGLPKKGDTLQLSAEVVRVDPHDPDTRYDKVTVRIAGYSIPVTLYMRDVRGEQE